MRQAVKFFGGVFGFLVPVGEWCVFRSVTPTEPASGLLAGVLPRGCSVS